MIAFMGMDSGLAAQLAGFREARRELEASVLPLATSVDGRRFSFQASLYGLEVQAGGYVVLENGGSTRLGQVITLDLDQLSTELMLPAAADGAPGNRTQMLIRHARGEGVVLDGDFAPFHDVTVRPAGGAEVRAWLERSARPGAKLRLGELASLTDVPCLADAGGFNRHTFLCGQSGSGKTYSLGVILEQLLTETDLRLVILDPNSDFVRLGTARGGTDPALAGRYRQAARGVTVLSAGAPGERRLRIHAAEIDPATQAGVLRLDPIADREEYAVLAGLLERQDAPALASLPDSEEPTERRLGLRVRNLGVDRFTVWAPDEAGSVLDAVHDEGARCVVIDLGSLPSREEQSLIAAAVLGDLWRRRHERKPVLIVIDEAHNVCPADPPDQLTAQAAEHAIRIAAEGRKFGLYLLVSTQRPQKIAENVLTQADNLVLMRLNSLADTAFTREVFSFVPPSLIDRAVTFRQGEALIAGKISPTPALLRFGARISEEGGADVPATWARLTGQRRRQPETRQQAVVEEAGDARDPAAVQGEHDHPIPRGGRARRVRTDITPERWLAAVRPHRGEPEPQGSAAEHEHGQQARGVLRPPEADRPRRHRQPRVVGQQGDQDVDVAALERVGEPREQLALDRGPGQRRLAEPAGGQLRGQGGPRPLQRAVDRVQAPPEDVGGLGGAEAERVPQHQRGPLPGRQLLQRRDERERDGLPGLVPRLRAGRDVGQLGEQQVRVGLQPHRLVTGRRLRQRRQLGRHGRRLPGRRP